ncbi:MAG: methyltransferase domain-containing protein [Kofleriaceae bacterium]|nr:methyltransferase domain-containing protein [Kofleriaceae bacterium]
MSKRDEDSQSDMEVGMTTAERRRRRRRGAGLRVPSDNVPRSRTPTAPPAPVPEDPALAMSIAYSFTNDASGPVSRSALDSTGPIAPEAASTVIDPPGEGQDFEMKTREMSAVDLEALGLADPSGASGQFARQAKVERLRTDKTNGELEVDVTLDNDAEPVTTLQAAVEDPTNKPVITRLKTVALSEDDLEEVRATTHPSRQSAPVAAVSGSISAPVPVAPRNPEANKTMQLAAIDVAVLTTSSDEPMSVPDIDIQELAERADSSGEIEVDVEAEEPKLPASSGRPASQSTPPPMGQATKPARAQTAPPVPQDGARTSASSSIDAQHAKAHPPAAPADRPAHHAPPPPPPAATQKPPAPPKKPLPQAAVAAVVAKEPSKPTSSKARPWFVDLFDEDYLRTLPFLTPQATQAEAEFVINAMNLAPGAQVLDLGCGYGRHAMELAARGFHVVGLDLSTPLLVRGGEESHRRGLTINFVRGDMRELDFENQFDAAYCLFSTFGYFDDETNKKTLQNVAKALKPSGKLLVEILNRDYVIADLPTRVWWEGDGCVVLEEVELNYFSSRIQVNRSVVFDDGRQLEQEISVRAYSLHEVGKLMHAAGFRVLEVSGGYQTRGRFFGNQSRHIIVLAERKETSGT